MIDPAPHVVLLEKTLATLQAVDWLTETGIADFTWRHMRGRYPTSSERPCGSLRWMGNSDANVDGAYHNEWERQRNCNIDLLIDLGRPTEDSAQDPTGWLFHSRIAGRAVEALRDTAGQLYPWCDWVIDGDEAPDEDSKPDEGRLVKPISVVYRVRTDDPNVLLAIGANG